MKRNPKSSKKLAVLTGLTALIGGAGVSNANANTTTPQTDTFNFGVTSPIEESASNSVSLTFTGFDTSLGTLTDVLVELNSQLAIGVYNTGEITATATLAGQSIASSDIFTSSDGTTSLNASGDLTSSLSSFTAGSVSASLTISAFDGLATWSGSGSPAGLTVTYEYTTTPLPPTLFSFVGGLAGLGFTTWRSRRKQSTKK
jgi:hypothetical protein